MIVIKNTAVSRDIRDGRLSRTREASMNNQNHQPDQTDLTAAENAPEQDEESFGEKALSTFYDIFEMFATVTIFVMILFAFFIRLNVVDGSSMLNTLHDGENLLVSDFCYTPTRGDIVIVHRIDAVPYNHPIVKRVIAVGGQTVDIDFNTWTLTVDGEVVDEPYRWLDPNRSLLTCEYDLPITLGENEIFVMGDNRNGSADSRQIEIGPVDVRTVVGKALVRVLPRSEFTVFKNPFEE